MLIEYLLDLATDAHRDYFSLSGCKLQSLFNDCKKRGGKSLENVLHMDDDILYLLYLQDKGELIISYKINGFFVYDENNIIYKKQYLLQNLKLDIDLIRPIKGFYLKNNVNLIRENEIIEFTNKLLLKGVKKYIFNGYTGNNFILSFSDVVLEYVDSFTINLKTTTEIINTLKEEQELLKKLQKEIEKTEKEEQVKSIIHSEPLKQIKQEPLFATT